METKEIRKESIYALIDLYDLHTKFFNRVIEGFTEKDANNRLNAAANHPSWIAGSCVQERYQLANALGTQQKSTFHHLFGEHKGIQDNITYPALTEFKKDWEKISPVLKNSLLNITDEQLESIVPFRIDGELTYYEAISFIIDRESYCIGQIDLYRRLLGYEAMNYEAMN
jgi:hypothetical protein